MTAGLKVTDRWPWRLDRLSAEFEAATAGADSKAALVRRWDGGGLAPDPSLRHNSFDLCLE